MASNCENPWKRTLSYSVSESQAHRMSTFENVPVRPNLCEMSLTEDVQSVEQLLLNGANIEKRMGGRTALMLAASQGLVCQVQLLLHYNADVSAKTLVGQTALHFAASTSHSARIIQILVKAGADTEARDRHGMTALMLAASFTTDRPRLVKTLIQNGSDINASNNRGMTALYLAASHGLEKTLQVLIENDADVLTVFSDHVTMQQRLSQLQPVIVSLIESGMQRMQRLRGEAFALGTHERLGENSRVRGLHPELVRVVLEHMSKYDGVK
jgi:ankyrin repeat protein